MKSREMLRSYNGGVQQINKEYMETGQKPVLGEKVGRPCKSYSEKEAQILRAATHAIELVRTCWNPLSESNIKSVYHIIAYTCT